MGRNVRQVSAEDPSVLTFLYFPFLCLYACAEPGYRFGVVAAVHLQSSFITADSSPRVSALRGNALPKLARSFS